MDLASEIGLQGFKWVMIVHVHGSPLHIGALDDAGDFFHDTYGGRMVNLWGLLPVLGGWGNAMSIMTAEQKRDDGVSLHGGASSRLAGLYRRTAPRERRAWPAHLECVQRGGGQDDARDPERHRSHDVSALSVVSREESEIPGVDLRGEQARFDDGRGPGGMAHAEEIVMRPLIPVVLALTLAACSSDDNGPTACCTTGATSLRVVNAFTTPVDVTIDGQLAIQSLAAGAIDTALSAAGSHTVQLRPTGGGAASTRSITTSSGALGTIAIVRASNGSVAAAMLDDTNSTVPAGATKVRVLHLAPNAGTLQVFRTQPDFQQPVSWQFPFTYQAEPTSVSAPFYQSTVGTWEVRVWQTPADATGWANAPVKVSIALASGEKRTVIILDKPGGGVRVELL